MRSARTSLHMATDYRKWDALDAEEPDDQPSHAAKEAVSVPDVDAARERALKAKAEGKAPSALDDIFTLKGDSSYAELREKMKNLPDAAKRQFLESMQSPGMMESLTQKVDALRAADPKNAGKMMVGMRVRLQGLKAKPELNGLAGKVMDFVEEKGRCAVLIDGRTDKILLKPENLDRA